MPKYEWMTSCFSRANGLKSVSRDVVLLVSAQLSIDELFIECHHQFKVLMGTDMYKINDIPISLSSNTQ